MSDVMGSQSLPNKATQFSTEVPSRIRLRLSYIVSAGSVGNQEVCVMRMLPLKTEDLPLGVT